MRSTFESSSNVGASKCVKSKRKRSGATREPDCFTWSPRTEALYAIALGWPGSGRLEIRSLRSGEGEVKAVRLLGHDGPVQWKQTQTGLDVSLPDRDPLPHALALQITGGGLDP